jgi:RNA polymerase-binding transcription factor DksA
MTRDQLQHYRDLLQNLLRSVGDTAAALEEVARNGVGGEAGGNLSNAPLHLGDLGSETYAQELNATLLENEEYIHSETLDALGRIEAGTYGRCERCGTAIIPERLEAVPYSRYCTPCAEKTRSGPAVNLNVGRPRSWSDPSDTRAGDDPIRMPGAVDDADDLIDRHAAGTAGGGTAVGGLAGTNIGAGHPDNADLEEAMGTGQYDTDIETDDDNPDGYAGPSGGAVGGTPAGKRASGGRNQRGIAP